MSDISIKSQVSDSLFLSVYQYPNWFNKKKYIFYNRILERLIRLSSIHTKASLYYEKMNFNIFGPSITITALSGIASFLSTSQYVSEGVQNGFGIGVGIVASISSVLQALAGACQYSAKKEAHRTVAEQYNNLIISVKFEIEMPNEEDFTDKLEVQILDIQSKCNYFVPQFIVDDYDKQHKVNNELNNVLNGSNSHTISNDSTFSNLHNENVVINIDDKNYNTFHDTGISENSLNSEKSNTSVNSNNTEEYVDGNTKTVINSSETNT
jgi:hypothetical protein